MAGRGSYLAGLFGDDTLEAALGEPAQLAAMLRVEAALAAAQAEAGTIPGEAADAIAEATASLTVAPADLAEATARDGVPVPALLARLHEALPEAHRPHIHRGATSQDIVDSAMVLCLKDALETLESRLERTIATLAGLADQHRATAMAGRTRGQQAAPTSFGLVAAGWLMPLVRARGRLPAVREGALILSLGGSVGTQAALGPHAPAVEKTMAAALDLGIAPVSWHGQRDGLVVLGGWLSGLAASLGKIGEDVLALSQSEVGEVVLAGAGGSSTMPNKRNPTAAEAVIALADRAADLIGPLHRSARPLHQRGGPAWFGEWLTLPDLAIATGAALARTEAMLGALQVDPARMRANLEASNGLLLAEAASFALADHMPRPEAQALVKEACAKVLERPGRHLFDILAERSEVPVDWATLKDPAAHLGQAGAMIERALAAARGRSS